MPKRRNDKARLPARAARIAGSLGFWLWAKAARRPVDTCALLAAIAATLIIIVNAVFLQSGARPAPFLANLPPPAPQTATPPPANPPPLTHTAGVTRVSQPVPVRRDDPIAELIGRTSRVMAVQRVLSNYGFGQIRPSGTLDQATKTAIEKFERTHNMPVTGQISDRLVSELSAMTGRPVE